MGISSFTVTKEKKLITFDKRKIEKCIVSSSLEAYFDEEYETKIIFTHFWLILAVFGRFLPILGDFSRFWVIFVRL
jgi:hypothetical protein